jgi:hypothetical protein
MAFHRQPVSLCGPVLLACGVWLLAGCGGGTPTNSGGITDSPAGQPGSPPTAKWRVNTYRSPTVYLSEPTGLDNLTSGQSVTVDGLVTGWDEEPRAGEKVRYTRLVSFRKTADPEGKK